MIKHNFSFLNIILSTLILSSFYYCKNEPKTVTNEVDMETNVVSETSKKIERKKIIGLVEAQIGANKFTISEFDQNRSTDVTYLDNGIQFRLNGLDNKTVLVNMYAPEFFKKIPITISQQSSALKPEESYEVKTQSRLEINIPSERPVQGDVKVLYEGNVKLEELSENKLLITFSGNGIPQGSNNKNQFSMEGKIVLENFNVYDGRSN